MIDRKAFRTALGSFVTGVTIVTACDAEGRPVGLTANSFNSVSLDPPMVLWSLALDSANLPVFRAAAAWAVHILAAGQEETSNRFASRGVDKFAGLEMVTGPEGAPLIEGCAARFGCRATFEYEGGDHAIFVGEVVDFHRADAEPLIFHGGRYGRVMPDGTPVRPERLDDDAAFGRHFTGHLLGRAYQSTFAELRDEYHRRGLRSSDYTVLTALGMGDGATPDELVARAANGGVDLPREPIDRLTGRGLIVADGAVLTLSAEGRTVLTELMAVAQATQLHIESAVTPQEMAMLHTLLARVCSVAGS